MKKKILVAALFFGLFMASGSAVNYTCSDLTKCATLHDDATYDGENILLSVGESHFTIEVPEQEKNWLQYEVGGGNGGGYPAVNVKFYLSSSQNTLLYEQSHSSPSGYHRYTGNMTFSENVEEGDSLYVVATDGDGTNPARFHDYTVNYRGVPNITNHSVNTPVKEGDSMDYSIDVKNPGLVNYANLELFRNGEKFKDVNMQRVDNSSTFELNDVHQAKDAYQYEYRMSVVYDGGEKSVNGSYKTQLDSTSSSDVDVYGFGMEKELSYGDVIRNVLEIDYTKSSLDTDQVQVTVHNEAENVSETMEYSRDVTKMARGDQKRITFDYISGELDQEFWNTVMNSTGQYEVSFDIEEVSSEGTVVNQIGEVQGGTVETIESTSTTETGFFQSILESISGFFGMIF